MRRAKIVCTLGPSAETVDRLIELLNAGMNVARLNMSHGDYNEHGTRLKNVRAAAEAVGKTVGVFADLQGPKIRLGRFADDKKVQLEVGDTFTITTDDILGDDHRCSTTYKGLPGDVNVGDHILIDDGKVGLKAVEVTDTDVVCEVTVPGPVSNNKGINLPGVAVSVPALSDKDERDLRWALHQDVDMIALSFVRSGDDIRRVHEIMDEEGRHLPVIAKLEKPQAIANLQEIIDSFDAFMVARGDLGVELPLEEVPLVQKRIIRAARKWAKPVIVATQMLESMITNPRPTRAEASDVANAILDGADAVMLSGETSVGDFPVETVSTMARIVEKTEREGHAEIHIIDWDPHTTGGILAKAAAEVAERIGARYLVAFTKSGDTGRRLSRLRSPIPMLVFSPERATRQTMTLSWGVDTHITPEFTNQEEVVEAVDKHLRDRGMIEVGERIVMLSGSPMGIPGKTNNLRVHKVKELGES
ncbi:pyruvate kinase [Tessaracoccus flavus]|uniref:Pyruvate kinase n=1 Tax=Tessaracoccus flavus TaxID=1610493 RepID=A0A1Q2CD90_9ACTN|nr:pyruvate kinase [Tessaracoccus flavus]AQP44092.1 pyruvate kinase [Tessaracoccus flavus]SDY34652.1 pyruvate kinase [Tessaracoccus flavus]